MKDAKILIVDDEKDLRELESDLLLTAGFKNILSASNWREARQALRQDKPDLILLDIMLPDKDGIEILKEIRSISKVPVILVSAKGEMVDKYLGFESGADDYIVKPFFYKELIYRIKALLKRTYQSDELIELDGSKVSFQKGVAYKDGEELSLTAKELEILKKLYENEGRIVSTASLCQTSIGDYWEGYENTLMSHISNLRKKIEADPSNPKNLLTKRGLGYTLVLKDEN